MPRAAGRVFRLIIIERDGRHDFDHAQGLIPHHRAGELLAGDVALHQDVIAERPIVAIKLLRRTVMILGDDEHPDAGALVDRLDDVRRRQRMLVGGLEPRHHAAFRHRNPRRRQDHLGQILLHGQRRGENAGVAVGHADRFEDALDRSVLTRPAVQHVESDVGLERLQHACNVATDIDPGRAIAVGVERLGTGLTGPQRDLALGRPAAHQNRNVLCRAHFRFPKPSIREPLLVLRFEVPTPPAANSCGNFKSKSGTRIIGLLMPLCFRSSCQRGPPCITNFGSGALAAIRHQFPARRVIIAGCRPWPSLPPPVYVCPPAARRSGEGGCQELKGEVMMFGTKWIAGSIAVAAAVLAGSVAAQQRSIAIATGGTGGVYYPLGGGLANILSKSLPGIQASAEVTGGSVDNLKLIGSGQAELAFTMVDATLDAYKGEDKFKGNKVDVRALAVLYPNRMHVVSVEGKGIDKMTDLKGKRVSTGSPGSATEVMAFRVIEAAGLDKDKDMKRERLSVAESVNAIKDRKIDAFFWVGGIPTAAVTDLAATPGVKMKLIDHGDLAEKMNAKYGKLYAPTKIKAGSYPGYDKDNSITEVWNLIVTGDKMSNEDAYAIVKTLVEKKADIVAVHKEAESFSLDNQVQERSPIPFHPGALKYFKEKGIGG